MLIIARRKGQRVVIGGDVEIVITEVTRGSVKIGVVAPAKTTIVRGELLDAVKEANRAAAEAETDPGALPLVMPAAAAAWEKPR